MCARSGTVPDVPPMCRTIRDCPRYCWMMLEEYRIRRNERQSWRYALDRQHDRLASLRLATIGVGVLVLWLVVGRYAVNPFWLALPLAVFAGLAIVHERVLLRREGARRAVTFYDRGLARLEDRWIGLGPDGTGLAQDDHLYAADLDLFGRGSVFQLISAARLGAGERTLADWLLAPADPGEIRARQAAVTELKPRLDLRERIALVGDEVSGWLDTSRLADWGTAPGIPHRGLAAVCRRPAGGDQRHDARRRVPRRLELGLVRRLRARVAPVQHGLAASDGGRARLGKRAGAPAPAPRVDALDRGARGLLGAAAHRDPEPARDGRRARVPPDQGAGPPDSDARVARQPVLRARGGAAPARHPAGVGHQTAGVGATGRRSPRGRRPSASSRPCSRWAAMRPNTRTIRFPRSSTAGRCSKARSSPTR